MVLVGGKGKDRAVPLAFQGSALTPAKPPAYQ